MRRHPSAPFLTPFGTPEAGGGAITDAPSINITYFDAARAADVMEAVSFQAGWASGPAPGYAELGNFDLAALIAAAPDSIEITPFRIIYSDAGADQIGFTEKGLYALQVSAQIIDATALDEFKLIIDHSGGSNNTITEHHRGLHPDPILTSAMLAVSEPDLWTPGSGSRLILSVEHGSAAPRDLQVDIYLNKIQ